MSKDRRFSLDEDFMNYSIDDLLYGSMQYLATFHPAKKKLYLTRKNLVKNKKDIYALCNLNSRSLNAHIQKLIDKKLVAEEEINGIPAYTFPYDYDGGYQIVNYEMLWYIVSTRNKSAIQVYVYLLNKYLWKAQTNERYSFTNKELQVAVGYSENTKLANSIMANVLESLSREGIIRFEEYYEENIAVDGSSVPTPKKRLVFVAKSKADLQEAKTLQF